mmetsp:Transcript_104707/g.333062  ORF Transcript_104707/g.333062 Transcript_104707/m.333062 type:complete len:206 (-) Transcript_104707:1-618(-)
MTCEAPGLQPRLAHVCRRELVGIGEVGDAHLFASPYVLQREGAQRWRRIRCDRLKRAATGRIGTCVGVAVVVETARGTKQHGWIAAVSAWRLVTEGVQRRDGFRSLARRVVVVGGAGELIHRSRPQEPRHARAQVRPSGVAAAVPDEGPLLQQQLAPLDAPIGHVAMAAPPEVNQPQGGVLVEDGAGRADMRGGRRRHQARSSRS